MNTDIKYTIRNSRLARRIRLAVYCDGRVVVTSPVGVHQSRVEKFISDKRNWVLSKLNFFKRVDNKAVRRFSKEDYKKYKDDALDLVKTRIEHYNKIYGFKFNKVFIKNQKTRWGSCSTKQNLNFNYKILFLPKELQDYLIVHEICHLKEFNHSKKFWALIQKALPNYIDAKKDLKKTSLHRHDI